MGRVRIGGGKAFAYYDATKGSRPLKDKSLSPAQINQLIVAADRVNKSEIGAVAGTVVGKTAEGVGAAGGWVYDKLSGLFKNTKTGATSKSKPAPAAAAPVVAKPAPAAQPAAAATSPAAGATTPTASEEAAAATPPPAAATPPPAAATAERTAAAARVTARRKKTKQGSRAQAVERAKIKQRLEAKKEARKKGTPSVVAVTPKKAPSKLERLEEAQQLLLDKQQRLAKSNQKLNITDAHRLGAITGEINTLKKAAAAPATTPEAAKKADKPIHETFKVGKGTLPEVGETGAAVEPAKPATETAVEPPEEVTGSKIPGGPRPQHAPPQAPRGAAPAAPAPASPPSEPIVYWKDSAEATAAMKEYAKFPSGTAVDRQVVVQHLNDAAPKIDKLSPEQAHVLLRQLEFKSSELNSIETGIKAMLKQKLAKSGGEWRTIAAELERKGTAAKMKLPEFKEAKVKSIGSLNTWDELVAEAGAASDPAVRKAILKRGMQLGGQRAPRTFFEGLLGPLTGYKKKERGREAVKELAKYFPKLKAAPTAYEKSMAHYKLLEARRKGLGLPSKGETPAARARIAAQIAKMDAEVAKLKADAGRSEAEANRIRRHTETRARLYTAQADKIRKELMREWKRGGKKGKKKPHTWVGVRLVRQDIQSAKAELKRLRTNRTAAKNVPNPGPAPTFAKWYTTNPVTGIGLTPKRGETVQQFMKRATLSSDKYSTWRKTWTDARKLYMGKKEKYTAAQNTIRELGDRNDPVSGIGSQLGRIKLLRDVELKTYNIEAERGNFAQRLPGTTTVPE